MKYRTQFIKIPKPELEVQTFQEHLTESLRTMKMELVSKIKKSFGPIRIYMIDESGVEYVSVNDQPLGRIQLKMGYAGDDLVNNKYSATWEFHQTHPVNES